MVAQVYESKLKVVVIENRLKHLQFNSYRITTGLNNQGLKLVTSFEIRREEQVWKRRGGREGYFCIREMPPYIGRKSIFKQ